MKSAEHFAKLVTAAPPTLDELTRDVERLRRHERRLLYLLFLWLGFCLGVALCQGQEPPPSARETRARESVKHHVLWRGLNTFYNPGQKDKAATVLAATQEALQALDYGQTKWALAHGFREMNPAAAVLFEHEPAAFLAKAYGAGLVNFTAKKLGKRPGRKVKVIRYTMLITANGIMSWVVIHNFRVIRRGIK